MLDVPSLIAEHSESVNAKKVWAYASATPMELETSEKVREMVKYRAPSVVGTIRKYEWLPSSVTVNVELGPISLLMSSPVEADNRESPTYRESLPFELLLLLNENWMFVRLARGV